MTQIITSALQASCAKAWLDQFDPTALPQAPEGKLLLAIAGPCCGGPFLSQAMSRASGLPRSEVSYDKQSSTSALYLPSALRDTLIRKAVTDMSLTPSPGNLQILKTFRVKPLIVTRDLDDWPEAIRQDLLAEARQGCYGVGHGGVTPTVFATWPLSQQHAYVNDMVMPELIRNQQQWQRLKSSETALLSESWQWICFEQLRADPLPVISNWAAAQEISLPKDWQTQAMATWEASALV